MCDSKKIRDAVFKKNLLRRLYGEPEEPETIHQDSDNISASTERTSVTAKYTCPVTPKKKVYSVLPRPPGVPPEKDSLLEEGSEFVREDEEDSESELEEEAVKKRRRRKRKQRSDDPSEGQNQKTERKSAANQSILTKNQKRKLKKKKRKEREKVKNPGENNKAFTYSVDATEDTNMERIKSRKEELSERLPKLVQFVRAVWEVYDQDVAVKKDTDSNYQEENLDTLLTQMTSIPKTEEEAKLDEFDKLWHLKNLLVLADHTRAEEKITHLENITTVAIDNGSRDLLCTLMKYWITDIANQR